MKISNISTAVPKKAVSVEEAVRILNNVLTEKYLIDRIEGGDFEGGRVGCGYYISLQNMNHLYEMIILKDYKNAKITEIKINDIDFDKVDIKGKIIDIGGGGEGIVEKRFKKNVIAVDKSLRELTETENVSLKVASDGGALPFKDNSFDSAAFFFSMMYMPVSMRIRNLAEVNRVLKNNSSLHIFEPRVICRNYKPIHLIKVRMNVKTGGKRVNASYGSVFAKKSQNLSHFTKIGLLTGFSIEQVNDYREWFHIIFSKKLHLPL
ncbi:MAG: class I SAM-dependent methyltransferase [bacterium]|nr:class I SAM-dependent methyltransferase [bacterium]